MHTRPNRPIRTFRLSPVHRRGLGTAGVALLVALATAVGPGVTPATAASTVRGGQSDRPSPRQQAEATLDAARALFASGAQPAGAPSAAVAPQSARTGDSAATATDPTLVLRDLALALPALRAADQRQAGRILARPSDPKASDSWGAMATRRGKKSCTPRFCVHWTTVGDNAPPLRGSKRDGVPKQVERTISVFRDVWNTEIRTMDFRAPKQDRGGSIDNRDPRFDIYLSDLGRGFYGYCAPDDKRVVRQAAYCVVDDDFSPAQFPVHTPLQNLQVTAAHEFNHAVQFNYDITEDAWIMEATSTWIEDEVYDAVNDNRQYLGVSNYRQPEIPLDYGRSPTWYGNWIFLRSVTEDHGADLVRKLWNRLAATNVRNLGDFSTEGLQNTLAGYGDSLPDAYARFAAKNQTPGSQYTEGAAYRKAPFGARVVPIGAGGSVPRNESLDHLTSVAIKVTPKPSLTPTDSVTFDVSGLTQSQGGRLMVVVTPASGDPAITVPQDPGTPLTLFVSDTVSWTVVVTNGSWQVKRPSCYSRSTRFACGGARTKNDNLAVTVTVTSP
jgi:hypothetical protein